MTAQNGPLHSAPMLLRGVARAIDIGVNVGILELAFQLSRQLPLGEGLLTLSDALLSTTDAAVAMLTMVIYTASSERWGGATLGKLCCGLRTVTTEGGRIGLKAAALRGLAFYVDGFMLGLVAYSAIARSERGQRVGDVWAHTLVVWRSQSGGQHGFGWLLGTFLGVGFVLLSYVVTS